MKRSDFDMMRLLSENLTVNSGSQVFCQPLCVDVFEDYSGKYRYQVQIPSQGNKYRKSVGQATNDEYGEWHELQS